MSQHLYIYVYMYNLFLRLKTTKCDEGLLIGYQRKRGGSVGPRVVRSEQMER